MNDINEEKLAYDKMNKSELNRWANFSFEIIENCKKMNIKPELFHYITDIIETKPYVHTNGYSDLYGFFSVSFGDRGGYTIRILSKEINQAKIEFLKDIVWCISIDYERQNRHEFENKWSYSTKYDGRKIHFEYAINMLLRIYTYEEIRDYVIERTNYMNRWFYDKHWEYNEVLNQFIEQSKALEHD
jgi:hypothetical protein